MTASWSSLPFATDSMAEKPSVELGRNALSLPLLAFHVFSKDFQSIGEPSLYFAFGFIV